MDQEMTALPTKAVGMVALNADIVGYSRLLADDFEATTTTAVEESSIINRTTSKPCWSWRPPSRRWAFIDGHRPRPASSRRGFLPSTSRAGSTVTPTRIGQSSTDGKRTWSPPG